MMAANLECQALCLRKDRRRHLFFRGVVVHSVRHVRRPSGEGGEEARPKATLGPHPPKDLRYHAMDRRRGHSEMGEQKHALLLPRVEGRGQINPAWKPNP